MNILGEHNEYLKSAQVPVGYWAARALAGAKDLEAQGLPTRKTEDWRYSALQFLKEPSFKVSNLMPVKLSDEQLAWVKQKLNPNFYDVVLVNGRLMPGLSANASTFKVLSLAQLMQQNTSAEGIFSLLQTEKKSDAFENLSVAFTELGVFVEIAKGVRVEKPIRLLHLTVGMDQAVYLQNFVEVRSGAKAELLQEHYSEGANHFESTLTQIYLEASANLTFCHNQLLNEQTRQIAKTRVFQKEDSQLHTLSFATGGDYTRHNLEVYLLGMRAHCQANGAALVRANHVSESYTVIDHVVGHCTSRQNYKTIVADQGRATFNGLVKIRQDSQKANSEQINKNLLLSKTAEANSKPELQIYADDVKATHGSTVGALDEQEVFYLQSRAIDRKTAIQLLSQGFLAEVIYSIEHPLVRDHLVHLLETAFAQVGEA